MMSKNQTVAFGIKTCLAYDLWAQYATFTLVEGHWLMCHYKVKMFGKLFENPSKNWTDIGWTHNTAMWPLSQCNDLDPKSMIHAVCMSLPCGSQRLFQVIWKSLQRLSGHAILLCNLWPPWCYLDLEPRSIHDCCALHTVSLGENIFAKLFEDSSAGWSVTERTRIRDGQMDGRTDRHPGGGNNVSPPVCGGGGVLAFLSLIKVHSNTSLFLLV